jgi:tetratricopeptide (TPR) repeat protein
MFFEMLTGVVPFDGEDPIAIGIKHIRDPVPSMSGDAAAFQGAMEIILAKTPEERYQHGRDFVEAIEAVEYTHADGHHRASHGRLSASRSGRIGRISTPASPEIKPAHAGRPLVWASAGTLGLIVIAITAALIFLPQNPMVQTLHQALPFSLPTAARPPAALPKDEPPADTAVIDVPADASTPIAAPDNKPALTNTTTPAAVTATMQTPTDPAPADIAANMPSPASEPLDAHEQTVDPATAAVNEITTAPVEEPASDDSLQPLINRLLAEANTAIEQRQLTRPEGQSALDKYNEILALAPDNTEAQTGIRKIATTYVVMAREATDRKDFSKAKEYLEQARTMAPDAAGLESADKSLQAAQDEAAQQRRAAEKVAAEKAREANQTDAMVARFRITGLLKSAEYHLANNQLTTPPGNNAWDVYSEVLKLDPANAAANAGRKQVEQRLLELLNAAVDSSNGAQARELMTQALRIMPGNPRINQLRSAVDALP